MTSSWPLSDQEIIEWPGPDVIWFLEMLGRQRARDSTEAGLNDFPLAIEWREIFEWPGPDVV